MTRPDEKASKPVPELVHSVRSFRRTLNSAGNRGCSLRVISGAFIVRSRTSRSSSRSDRSRIRRMALIEFEVARDHHLARLVCRARSSVPASASRLHQMQDQRSKARGRTNRLKKGVTLRRIVGQPAIDDRDPAAPLRLASRIKRGQISVSIKRTTDGRKMPKSRGGR